MKMNTLIIPCAGKSSRFDGMLPKWMLKYPDGKPMVEESICGLPLVKYDRVIVTAVREHLDKYSGEELLRKSIGKKLGNKFELCILDNFTSCQAETVYETIKRCHIEGAFAVKDSDNYIEMDLTENTDFVVGLNMHMFKKEIERLSAKSFLMINSQGIITDIIEKKIVSEYISIGMYGFRSSELYCAAFESLSNSKGMENEIYISHVISYLIGTKQSVYSYVEANDYEDWGTKKDWYSVLNTKRTVFVNVEGIITKTVTSGGGEIRYCNENIEKLTELSRSGCQIVLISSMNKEKMAVIENKLVGIGIKIHASIPECYASHQLLIQSFSSEIPYPACQSLNIREGDNIGDLLRDER